MKFFLLTSRKRPLTNNSAKVYEPKLVDKPHPHKSCYKLESVESALTEIKILQSLNLSKHPRYPKKHKTCHHQKQNPSIPQDIPRFPQKTHTKKTRLHREFLGSHFGKRRRSLRGFRSKPPLNRVWRLEGMGVKLVESSSKETHFN